MTKSIRSMVFLGVVVACAAGAGTAWGGFFEKTKRDILPEGYVAADIERGGLLYDRWWYVAGEEPKETHPLYPAAGKASGSTTWRCQECHGWDYLGKDGSYAEGPHFTGIKGIYEVRTKRPEEVFLHLTDRDGQHDFSRVLETEDLWALVKFIREGLIDIRKALDDHGRGQGDLASGEAIFREQCIACHGDRGNMIDFKERDDCVAGIGWLANVDPAKALHKTRWGSPGSDAPSMVMDKRLSFRKAVDMLTYAQTLEDQCLAATGLTTQDIGMEMGRHPEDKDLRKAEDALEAVVADFGATLRVGGAGGAGNRLAYPAFQIAHREFLVFRAAHCRWFSMFTGATPDEKARSEKECLVRMTEERTRTLENIRGQGAATAP